MTSRGSALVCLAAGVLVARPAAAAMTMVFRDGRGRTSTFHQEGSRVQVPNPTGEDDGEVVIVDLKTNEHLLVYDDAKAYLDFNKAFALARAVVEPAMKAKEQAARRRPATTVRYRALTKTKTVNGFSCEMYERVVSGRVDAEICYARWGDGIGQEEDFAWFDAYTEKIAASLAGKGWRPKASRSSEKEPGLAIWMLSIEKDGSREVHEIAKISRDPLPAAMFQVPADYREVARPISISERPRNAAPRAGDFAMPGTARPLERRLSGLIMILLVVGIGVGLLIHTVILHLAANIVIDEPRLVQALVAATIVWVVLVVAGLFRLPPVLSLAVSALATFAGLKISYGASIGRTLALFVVSGMIVALASYAAAVLVA